MECELFATHTVSQLGTWSPDPIALGVVVTAVKRQISKRSGAEFARLTVEDFSGSSEVLVFPESWGLLADRIRGDVHHRTLQVCGIPPRDVVLVQPGTLPKTSSGKLQRAKCREQYLDETLATV